MPHKLTTNTTVVNFEQIPPGGAPPRGRERRAAGVGGLELRILVVPFPDAIDAAGILAKRQLRRGIDRQDKITPPTKIANEIPR